LVKRLVIRNEYECRKDPSGLSQDSIEVANRHMAWLTIRVSKESGVAAQSLFQALEGIARVPVPDLCARKTLVEPVIAFLQDVESHSV
jgi:hypothetical protein